MKTITEEEKMAENLVTLSRPEAQDEFHPEYADITTVLPALDEHIVRESFTGSALAGDSIEYRFNRYGQLDMVLKGQYKLSGSTKRAVLKELYDNPAWFQKAEEAVLDEHWALVRGVLFPGGSNTEGSFLFRGTTFIGFYRKGTSVSKTMKFYDQKVFKTISRRYDKAHKTVDYRPHVRNDIYDAQEPMFTREEELEEVYQFLKSLTSRRLSNEENEIIDAIRSVLG